VAVNRQKGIVTEPPSPSPVGRAYVSNVGIQHRQTYRERCLVGRTECCGQLGDALLQSACLVILGFRVLFCFVLVWFGLFWFFCLFCFILFCFVVFYFVLFCFILFCFVVFYFVLFCFVLFCFCFVLLRVGLFWVGLLWFVI
jgi:hypothetical protein